MKRPLILTILCLVPGTVTAQAQPDINNAPKADNPTNRAARNRRITPNMTPQERVQWAIKRQFAALGADDATQELLANFVLSEGQARQKLMEKSQPLQSALRAQALSDSQIAALLNAYQGALEDEKTRRAKAIADLEKSIDLKKSPKIEAALTLLGVVGDGPTVNTIGRGGLMGGFGNRNNGFGGNGFGANGFGGRAGRNNRNNAGNGNNANNVPAQGA